MGKALEVLQSMHRSGYSAQPTSYNGLLALLVIS